jgi:hypothetical protein
VVLIVYSCSTPLALALGIALNWGSSQAHCGDGFLLSKRHVSTDVCWGYQQPTVISTVHEVAVRAALAVWALGICGVGIKLPVATSKLLLGQPSHASRVMLPQLLLLRGAAGRWAGRQAGPGWQQHAPLVHVQVGPVSSAVATQVQVVLAGPAGCHTVKAGVPPRGELLSGSPVRVVVQDVLGSHRHRAVVRDAQVRLVQGRAPHAHPARGGRAMQLLLLYYSRARIGIKSNQQSTGSGF